jgi:hypothetical protein
MIGKLHMDKMIKYILGDIGKSIVLKENCNYCVFDGNTQKSHVMIIS